MELTVTFTEQRIPCLTYLIKHSATACVDISQTVRKVMYWATAILA